jgi:hypothetical protein
MKKYNRSDLGKAIRRFITRKEKELNRKCRMIWEFENRQGQKFLFGNFCINRNRLIVTIAHYQAGIGWIPSK